VPVPTICFSRGLADMINVLLVEDDIINQMVACRFLKRWGVDVTIANGGFEALQLVRNKNYRLILMDMQMPDLDGCETTTRIRALEDPYYKTVPIIAFTASNIDEIRHTASLHGINDFVSKPLNLEEMSKINQYII
jgi:CheY-like chemotaxis protein